MGEVGDCGKDKDRKIPSTAGVGNCNYLHLLDLSCYRQDWQSERSSQLGLSPADDEGLLKEFKQKSHTYEFSFYIDPHRLNVERKFKENKSENMETS